MIWIENFESGYSDNDVVAQDNNLPVGPDWTKSGSPTNYWRVEADNTITGSLSMSGRNTDGTMTWTSESIDISLYTNVSITIDLAEANCESTDIIETFYNIGAGNVEFGNGNGNGNFNSATNTVSGLSGATLVITVTLDNDGGNEVLTFDNISVFGTRILGPDGPGGVGDTDGSFNLKFWVRPDAGVFTTGTSVDSLRNHAGVAALTVSETGGQRPTLVSGVVNGYDEISFNGSNRLRTGLTLTTSNFIENAASSFVVVEADNTSQSTCVYNTDPLVGSTRFSCHIPWSNTVYYDIGNCCGTTARLQVGSLTGLTSYSIWSYDADPTTGKQLYRNGTLLQDRAGTENYSSHASQRFGLGGNTSGTAGFEGNITEVAVFKEKVNQAQRIIIQNYLSAKYDIALAANDLFTMDNVGNGDYDHDMAGIGQATDGSNHLWAQGTGIVRIGDADNLGNGEYLMWAHDNGALSSNGVTDLPAGVEARLERIWRPSETGEVGNVSISFDLSTVPGAKTASDLRLLIDTDNDGLFSDEGPGGVISGATDLGGDVFQWTGIDIENGLRFALGSVNFSQTPLPVTLVYFGAERKGDVIEVGWVTETEINNDYFELVRSFDLVNWQELARVPGAGTSRSRQEYTCLDKSSFKSTTYYKLIQVDYNGKREPYGPIAVHAQLQESPSLVHPNPTTGDLFISDPSTPGNYQYVICTSSGRIIRSGSITKLNDVNFYFNMSKIPSGAYTLQLELADQTKFFRFIKK